MRKSTVIFCTGLVLTTFAACETQPTKHRPTTPPPYGHVSGSSEGESAEVESTTPDDSQNAEASGMPQPTPTPQPTPPPAFVPSVGGNIPYGTPVAGKPGFVYSPHSPNAGLVDVRGFAPGSEVKDPYTGKIFLVP